MGERMADSLGGRLTARPGAPVPNSLRTSRPDWVARITEGQQADALPGLLASLFSLCSHAHRLCAGLALAAARGDAQPASLHARRTLQTETMREHVRRMGLDWPEQLGGLLDEQDKQSLQRRAMHSLTRCPALRSSLGQHQNHQQDHHQDDRQTRPAMRQWVESQLLGMDAERWLAFWDADNRAWLDCWSRQPSASWLAGLLHAAAPQAQAASLDRALKVHAHDDALCLLAKQLRDQPAFARAPAWLGECAETGSWTRLNQPVARPMDTPFLRLGARIAELARLCLPDEPCRSGGQWLCSGSVQTGPHSGLAWIEMARGLLIHCVTLESSGAAQQRIAACHVLAPTEWNFHPRGAVARTLAQMPACHRGHTPQPPMRARILTLMSAFDPCVPFDIQPAGELASSSGEVLHA